MTNFYVYYRVAPAQLAELGAAVQRLFAAVERETRIRGRWMRRRDEEMTYMEVYEGVSDDRAFGALLERECGRLGLARLLAPGSARHTEIFVAARLPA